MSNFDLTAASPDPEGSPAPSAVDTARSVPEGPGPELEPFRVGQIVDFTAFDHRVGPGGSDVTTRGIVVDVSELGVRCTWLREITDPIAPELLSALD